MGVGPSNLCHLPSDDTAEDHCFKERLSVPWPMGTSGFQTFWHDPGYDWQFPMKIQCISIPPVPNLTTVLCAGHLSAVFQIMASMLWHIGDHSPFVFCPLKICWDLLSTEGPFPVSSYYYFKIVSGRRQYKYLCLIHYLNLIFTSLSDIHLLFFNC